MLRSLDVLEHLFDTSRVEYVEPPPPWEEGRQDILNALEAQMPRHTFKTPVPVVARIEWAGTTAGRPFAAATPGPARV